MWDWVTSSQSFMITPEQAPAALAAFQACVRANEGAMRPYLPVDEVLAAGTLADALRAFRLEPCESLDEVPLSDDEEWTGPDPEAMGPGGILGYQGPGTYWFEDTWFPAIAPFVVPGSRITFENPLEHEFYRYEFDGAGVRTRTGTVVFAG